MRAVVSPKDLDQAVRFLLELATLVALGLWGSSSSSGTVQRYAIGLGVAGLGRAPVVGDLRSTPSPGTAAVPVDELLARYPVRG